MKFLFLFPSVLFLGITFCAAQEIIQAEYFIDTDPGVGNATSILLSENNSAISISEIIDLTGVSLGFHTFSVRSKTDSMGWGHTQSLPFRVELAASNGERIAQPLVEAEYFIDTDPGAGNAISLLVSENDSLITLLEIIDLTGVPVGFHTFSVRSKTSVSGWGHARSLPFRVELETSTDEVFAEPLVEAEYFIDTDPGAGNAISLLVSENDSLITLLETIDLTGVPVGFHTFSVRTQTSVSGWGHTRSLPFRVELANSRGELLAEPLVEAEYFIDTDPGGGNAKSLFISENDSLVSLLETIDITGVSVGFHVFSLRAKSSSTGWGHARAIPFRVEEGGVISNPLLTPSPIIAAEFYIDSFDPGLGKAIPIPVIESDTAVQIAFSIPVPELGIGIGKHKIFARVADSLGNWSAEFVREFEVSDTLFGVAVLKGKVDLQGRSEAFGETWSVPLVLDFYNPGETESVFTVNVTTDERGSFETEEIDKANYVVTVKNNTTLKNAVAIRLASGDKIVDFGSLREGDANNDNFVGLSDFSLLASSFNLSEGAASFEPRADFNRDAFVGLSDFSLLAANFNQQGDVVTAESFSQLTLNAARVASLLEGKRLPQQVKLSVEIEEESIGIGETFEAIIWATITNGVIDGAETHLGFDANALRIKQVIPGRKLDLVLQNEYDNKKGLLDLAVGSLNARPEGRIELARITFEAIGAAAESQLELLGTAPRTSQATYLGVAMADIIENDAISIRGKGFEMYPNPTAGMVKVDLYNPGQEANRLEIYNLEGKLLWFSNMGTDKVVRESLDFSELLGRGTFLVRMMIGNEQFSKKIVVE